MYEYQFVLKSGVTIVMRRGDRIVIEDIDAEQRRDVYAVISGTYLDKAIFVRCEQIAAFSEMEVIGP